VYYGDGDRDGRQHLSSAIPQHGRPDADAVEQATANAGFFGAAGSARLYGARPIMDPVCTATSPSTVEAQGGGAPPFSLLNWIEAPSSRWRNQPSRPSAAATLEFVGCPNRKILAYLRRDERETILVVAQTLVAGVDAAGGASI